MTKDQIKKARTLLAKAKINNEGKEAMVESFTDGRTVSLTEMDYNETQDILKHLEQLVGQPPSEADKQKRKILSLAHEMRWYVVGTVKKLDMDRINGWCEKQYGMPLDALNYLNLNKAVYAFSKVHEGYLKAF